MTQTNPVFQKWNTGFVYYIQSILSKMVKQIFTLLQNDQRLSMQKYNMNPKR